MIFPSISSAKSILFSPVKHFIHDDFYDIVQRMPLFDRILFMIIHGIDQIGIPWHRLPVFLGLIYLAIRRYINEEYNLFNVGRTPVGVRFNPVDFPYRTADGKFNDPFNEGAGSEGTFFGRNMSPVDQKDKLLQPDPMVVATKLMRRRKLIDTGKQFNMIAASWIQFMIHDWIDHLEETQQIELTAPQEVAGECPLKSFKFYKTKVVDTGFHDIKKGHLNTRTPWWDGSALYGSDLSKLQKLRTFKDGKLKIGKDGLLQHDNDGVPLSGDVRNSWIGLSTLQALFILEHNKICDTLKKEYQDLGDEDLYRHARLVTSAVIAKIHTIDWTVELLKTDMLQVAMRANWYGLLGKKFKDTFGHVGGAILGGLVGLKKPNNHGVPYSLTEEFVSVYRMHSLLPDELLIRDINSAPGPNKSLKVAKQIDMINLIGWRGEKELSEIGFTRQMVSMGHQASGALELWNYPLWLRDVVPQNVDGTDRPDHVDLPSLEIYRDRERNVARYNEFRRSLFLIPISKWEDLTDDQEAIKTLREVYDDDVEQLDLLVGMAAEKKIKGFAISETAFVIFIIMASRRLEADRFFTTDFNEEVYTKKGLEWVNTTESLKDVLDRHYPEMTNRWMNSESAFTLGALFVFTEALGSSDSRGSVLNGLRCVLAIHLRSEHTALDAPDGYIPLYLSLFSIGDLRFPLNAFYLDVFEYFECHFPLLNPFGVARVMTFAVACKAYGGEPTLPLFRSFLTLGPAGDWLPSRKGPTFITVKALSPTLILQSSLMRFCEAIFPVILLEPILYLVGLASSWEHAPIVPSIFIDGEGESSYVSKNKEVSGFELAVVGGGPLEPDIGVVGSFKKKRSITAKLEEGAIVIKLTAVGSSSKHEPKRRKQEGPKRVSERVSFPPPPAIAPKGIGKHPRMLAHHLGSLDVGSESLVPYAQEAYSAHNVLSVLHCSLLKNNLDSLSLDDMANIFYVHALSLVVVGNMLTNESRAVSRDYSKLKDDFVSLKSKNSLLEHEMSKLEDCLSKARKNHDVESNQVVKDLRSENAWNLEELSMMRAVKRLRKRCQDLEAERDFLLSKESEEIAVLSSKLKVTDLKRVELVRDLLPLAIKKLFASEHFNHASGDLQQKAITYERSQALDEVQVLGDSWDFKDVEDYHPDAEKIYDEAMESFYKLEFPYISILVEKVGQSVGKLAVVDPPVTQEATS
ncbi:alpha-dioxygenase 1-like protein [Tanacetum coccineum]|uniref:Alpha-dioxygenase 1-like protein n=1 Tax=Tanacetum coccineum TaxID=301880 RepID=A0ABQ5BS55_9ASTR